ncbi:P-loop containing nucleoside triphosphate hydrolase protein [Mycena polygramma]|nr:P-loop containing nucleoside triphosphate hydrolase protein [Mycena polygramma]
MDASSLILDAKPTENPAQWMERVLCTRCKIPKLHPFQLELSLLVDKKKHIFLVIATGMGKTVVLMAGPIAASARGEKGIALFIVPTKALVEQQAEVASRRGLRALAINQDTVRDARLAGRDLFKELANGDDVRMGVMTPKMLFEADMSALLRNTAFIDSVHWVSIDEAQLVKQEGIFQAGYESLLYLHIRLQRSTTYALATATAPPLAALSMAKALGLHPGQYTNARYSVDRPNLKYIPRFFRYPTTTGRLLDFSFVVPIDMQQAADIIPTLIFRDTISSGDELQTALDFLIPAHIPGLRVLIVTDTATYGFDISGVRRVIIGDLPKLIARLEQQMGRAGRDGKPAEVIVFAPEWVREPPPGSVDNSVKGKTDAERRANLLVPILRWFNLTPALCPRAVLMEHNCEPFVSCGENGHGCVPVHDGEGSNAALAMVARWAEHFETKDAAAAPPRVRSDGTYPPLEKQMKESLAQLLDHWQHKVWFRIRPSDDDPSECFLPQYVMEAIVEKAHVCTSLENLGIIANGFDYMDKYGPELLHYLTNILDGFKQIFDDRLESESESETATYGSEVLELYATVPVLKHYCRSLGLEVSGIKSTLVTRLATGFITAGKLYPTRDEIAQVKADLMQVDEAPLTNKTNMPTPSSPTKKKKRKRGVGEHKEN